MQLFFQPYKGSPLGEILKEALQAGGNTYHTLDAAIAYARLSGVRHIQPALSDFVAKGCRVRLILGIDQQGTSFEALTVLLDVIGDSGEIWIHHDERPNVVFHPKVYLFIGDSKSQLIVGSGNLTEGGLYTNDEAFASYEVTSSDHEGNAIIDEWAKALDVWCSVESSITRRLDKGLLQELLQAKLIVPEAEAQKFSRPDIHIEDSNQPQTPTGLFGVDAARPKPPKPSRPMLRDKTASKEVGSEGDEVLIRYVPRAGGRTSQVHFRRSEAEDYFGYIVGGDVRRQFQQRQLGEEPGPIEDRPLVFSAVNMNAKIELLGAKQLSSNYPDDASRPILIFQRIEQDFYQYMLLMSGDDGYRALAAYLDRLPPGPALPSAVMNLDDLLEIWPNYGSKGN